MYFYLNRVGKSSLVRKFLKDQFEDNYSETNIINVSNKLFSLIKSEEESNPYSEINKIQLRLFDPPGRDIPDNINLRLVSDMNILLIVFDITNENSYNCIQNIIDKTKGIFTQNISNSNEVNLEDNFIKQPKSFEEIPLLLVGNKSDLNQNRAVTQSQVDEYIKNLKEKNNYSFINYYETSVKDGTGIENIFQDVVLYYFKRKIDTSPSSQIVKSIVTEKKTDNGETKEKKTPVLDKNKFIFHQMFDKQKKKLLQEMSSLKEDNNNEKIKNKNLEEKIEMINKDFNNEKNVLNEKLNLYENKTNKLEEELKSKTEEIDNLNQKVNEYILTNKERTLKFKISSEKIHDEISINVKGETKFLDSILMLYELCPDINDLNIKGFCVEGKENEMLDEMKTVNENHLVDGSLIVLIV